MSITADPSGATAEVEPAPVGSPRMRLARLARLAALGVPGVVETDAGESGHFVTRERDVQVDGILCVAAPGAGYDVALRLVCGLVPLHPLGDAVRAAVIRAATIAELPLGRVDVHIAGVSDRRWD